MVSRTTKGVNMGVIKAIQINDLHIPFHDKEAFRLLLDFLEYFRPHKLVIAGDFLDFYQLSKFDKNPNRRETIQDELDSADRVLRALKSLVNEIHFIAGNHEKRLRKFLWKNPELSSLKVLELSKLLNLDLLNIDYHEVEYVLNDFRFSHGTIVRSESGMSAKAEHVKYGSSCSQGHTHRMEAYYRTDARGTTASFNMGCMCELQPEYMEEIPNWQQGFGVFYFDDNRFYCQQVPIVKHKFIFNKKVFK